VARRLSGAPRALWWIISGGCVLRLLVFSAAVGSPSRFWSADDREYLPLATHLHRAYLASSGALFDLGLRRPPGYPLFIRGIYDVFGRHYAAVVAIQLVLSVATILLTFLLASFLLGQRHALVAAGLVACDPSSIVFANQLLTETLFACLLVAAMLVLVLSVQRHLLWTAAASGVVLGAALLVRPIVELIPLVLVPTLVLAGRSERARSAALAAAFLAGFLIPAGGWALRNYVTTGQPIISTIDGYNMLQYRAVGALANSVTTRQLAQHDVLVELAKRTHPGDNAAEVSRAELRAGLTILANHPIGAFKDWSQGEARLLLGGSRSETATLLTGKEDRSQSWLRILVALEEIVTVATVLGAIVGAGLWLLGGRRPRELWLVLLAAVYLIAISGGHEAYSRFRVPVEPLLALFAAIAADRIRLRARASAGARRAGRRSGRSPT
jgi:4-amino-4-deoxy-L-arabinose transferase-like glycosyltransferase